MLGETLVHLARNGAGVGSRAAAALAGTIAQETVGTNKMVLADKFCLGFGSEDRDKDSLQCPEWKFKMRNHFALVDQSRGEESDLSFATEELQSRALHLYGVLAKVISCVPRRTVTVTRSSGSC